MFMRRFDQMKKRELNARRPCCCGDFRQLRAMCEQVVAVEREPFARISCCVGVDPTKGGFVFGVG